MMRSRGVLAVVLTGLVLSACAGQANVPIAEDTTSTTQPASTAPAAEPTTTTSGEPAPTTGPGLAGEEIDFGIVEGAELTVVRVPHDDVLNVRAGPGIEAPVIAELPPISHDVQAMGKARQLDNNSIWFEVLVGSAVGWANASYLAYPGPTADVTAVVVSQLGALPSDPSAEDVALLIAELQASDDPPSEIVFAQFRGDRIVVEVIGLGDDSVLGYRLAITFNQGAGAFIESVQRTDLCARGVAVGNLCA